MASEKTHTPGKLEYRRDEHKIVSLSVNYADEVEDMEEIPLTVISTFGAMGGDNPEADAARAALADLGVK